MIVKLVHISCAVLSISGFVGRSFLKFSAPQHLQRRWLKIAPHVIDSALLASGIVMVFLIRQFPFVVTWVTIKLLFVVLYIGFGLFTLRFARTRTQTVIGFVGACLCFSYIIVLALTKQMWPF